MKQVAQNYKTGLITLEEVPVPACKDGGVLVRTDYSLISLGTETMKVAESKLSLLGKARARPDQVKKVMQSVSQQGLWTTFHKVMNRLDSLTPLGYSLCGVVEEVGEGARDFAIGQRVACGGDSYAHHAEFNWIPKNLCAHVPPNVESKYAAFTTVGAIAVQGYRQSEVKLGETACVIGLGLLGQLLVQILRASGVRVIGFDVNPERCGLAEQQGADACGIPGAPSGEAAILKLRQLTDEAGSDCVFLTAGGNTNRPVELAAELARDRARVVDIGKCRLDIPWKDYYLKELDLRFSRSYGPGRYDAVYEEGGIDYPIGYVRWTEQRNMRSFLDLLSRGDINLEPLVDEILPFRDAVNVYQRLNSGDLRGVGVLFQYEKDIARDRRLEPKSIRPSKQPDKSRIRLGVIGCGNYASSMLLPHLARRDDVALVEVVTSTGLSAANACRKFLFERASTDYRALLADESIDAVLIATRHNSHARMVRDALRAAKTVFVEKPLALDDAELQSILDAVEETGNDRLMVGFNRRFSSLLAELKDVCRIAGPQTVHYRVNAGKLDEGSWYRKAETQGARFVGEGCHFIDTISWWLECEPKTVFACNSPDDPDNVIATLHYSDGSIATVAYLTQGDNKYPKESMEIFGEGKVAIMNNYERTEFWRGGKRRVKRSLTGIEKGQKSEMEAFVQAAKTGTDMPIALESQIATTRATFAVMRSLRSGRVETVAPSVNSTSVSK